MPYHDPIKAIGRQTSHSSLGDARQKVIAGITRIPYALQNQCTGLCAIVRFTSLIAATDASDRRKIEANRAAKSQFRIERLGGTHAAETVSVRYLAGRARARY